VICIQGGLKYLLNMVEGTAIETMAREIRRKLLCKLAGARPSERTELNSGSIVSILTGETEDASGFAGEAVAVPLLAGGTILYVLGYLVWVQPEIAILAIAIYSPQAIVVPLTQHTINRLARLRIQLVRNLGHVAVRSFESVAPQGGTVRGLVLSDRIFRIRIWIYFRKFWLAALGNFLDSVGTIIVLTFGGYLVIEGKTEVSTLVVFMSGLAKIADPWDQLVNFYRSVSNTAVMYGMIQTKLQVSRSTIIDNP
jgi:ABC-type multidrug transport system fused ATPase/permease subunit